MKIFQLEDMMVSDEECIEKQRLPWYQELRPVV